MQRILMITGWGVGTHPLDLLKNHLTEFGYQVELINVFNLFDAEALQKHVQLAAHFDVIIGWSLGGQLAAKLVQYLHEQTGKLNVLITLASNPCFVANASWNVGMENATFLSFKDSFEKDPWVTLKRFCYLVTQGSLNAKQDWMKLQNSIYDEDLKLKTSGLEMLECLNTVSILQNYPGEQLHIFAEEDGLVSYKVMENFRKLGAKFLKLGTFNGSHAFPVFQSESVSGKITQYLKELSNS